MSNLPSPAEAIFTNAPIGAPPSFATTRQGASRGDLILRLVTGGSAMVILLMLAALVAVLAHAALPSIQTFGWSFITSTDWRPNELERPKRDAEGKLVLDEAGERIVETIPPSFGALNVIYGTAVSSAIALIFAVPLSLGAAIFLIRVAPDLSKVYGYVVYSGCAVGVFFLAAWLIGFGRPTAYLVAFPVAVASGWALIRFVPNLSASISFLVEFLAAIPSIAYGLWALFVLAPFLNAHLEPFLKSMLGDLPGFKWMFFQEVVVGKNTVIRPIPLVGRDMLCGGLVLGIMIVPIITAIGRDVLKGVPRAQVEGTTALGATWWQSSKEMLKYSRSGLFGAIMLGLARAAGETMAVTMVIGNNNQIAASPFAPAQTMSSLLATQFGEADHPLHRAALVEVALILLVMSLAFNVVARYLVVGKQSRSAAAH